jgi:hypothetical protein
MSVLPSVADCFDADGRPADRPMYLARKSLGSCRCVLYSSHQRQGLHNGVRFHK